MYNMKDFAIIFDMDGVIVDSNPAHTVALKQFCTKYGYELDEEKLREKIYGRANKDWIPNLFGEISKEKLKSYADEKEALYREIYKDTIAPVKGLENFLKMLEKNDIKKAIATSAPSENVSYTLENTNLKNYFDTILDESFVSRGKPDPEIYIKTVQALNFKPENCIVVEDSLSGIQSAQKAGCKVIGILTTHTKEEFAHTDLVIKDFDELTIDKLEGLFK